MKHWNPNKRERSLATVGGRTRHYHAYTLAIQHFGLTEGRELADSFTRLAVSQAARYDWMVAAVRVGLLDTFEMVLDAVSEAVLLSADPDWDGDTEALVLPAWKATSRAWFRWVRHGKGVGVREHTPVVPVDEVDVADTVQTDLGEATLDLSSLTEKQAAVIAARLEGMTWPEVSALVGYSPKSPGAPHAFWRGVSRILEANPEVVERFGLVPCHVDLGPKRRHIAACLCRGAKYLYENGEPL